LREQFVAHNAITCRGAVVSSPRRVNPIMWSYRADGGPTSLTNLKGYCTWHHHVLLHELGWKLIVHPDGTSQVISPDGETIHSHHPPPRPGRFLS
jgi:hypothetical protein